MLVLHVCLFDTIHNQVIYANESGVQRGYSTGDRFTFVVPDGDPIVGVEIYSGTLVDSLRFILSSGATLCALALNMLAGVRSPKYGGNGGGKRTLIFNGNPLAYIFGREGNNRRLDAIGFAFQEGPQVRVCPASSSLFINR